MTNKLPTCPFDRTLNLINKKWSIQIIRDIFFGKRHFKEFQEDKPNLSNKVLSNCLKELENNGLIEKKVSATKPTSTTYFLTDYGKSMKKIIYELAMFTLDNENNYTKEEKNNLKKQFREILDIED